MNIKNHSTDSECSFYGRRLSLHGLNGNFKNKDKRRIEFDME